LGVRKSYYRANDGREDALVLVREMDVPLGEADNLAGRR